MFPVKLPPDSRLDSTLSKLLAVGILTTAGRNQVGQSFAYEFENIMGRLLMNLSNDTVKDTALTKANQELLDKGINVRLIPEVLASLTVGTQGRVTKLEVNAQSIRVTASQTNSSASLIYHIPRIDGRQSSDDHSKLVLSQPELLAWIWDNVESYFLHEALGLDNGQSWSYGSVLDDWIQRFNLTIDAFASPFNNRLPQFCSLYPVIDHSLGDFLLDHLPVGNYLVNPPYTPALLEAAVTRVLNYLSTRQPFTFCFAVPVWTNPIPNWSQQLTDSPFKRAEHTYQPGTFTVRKSSVINGEIITEDVNRKFSLKIVVLAS